MLNQQGVLVKYHQKKKKKKLPVKKIPGGKMTMR